ncbi:MAG: maltotransferase domain-containing protein, partial [Candidatus Binatia bacterium]
MRTYESGTPGKTVTVAKSRALPRVVIAAASPEIDGGRYVAKRVVGDALVVGADVFKEGHD